MTAAPGPGVYRAPMRSRLVPDPMLAAVDRALERGVVGVGGRLSRRPKNAAEAIALTEVEHDARTARRLERFIAVPVSAEVWTRDAAGHFHRGVVRGDWCYDPAPQATHVDLTHVRPCAWEGAPVAPPAAVLEAFARGGLNFQRIRTAERGGTR